MPRSKKLSPQQDNTDKERVADLPASKIIPQPIVTEMQTAYLDYAMSVIVSRALPDVRDGLKPVQRRILYAMWDIGLKAQAKFRKSATVVGEVLGKYHPHGDIPVYDAMARLAQNFSLRYPLVNGQGNWGSLDGDPPAAMRYTEAKLNSIAEELLVDIDKETVEFMPNYDGTHKEPKVLPGKLPNLLINGTMGIAVGMATNIPPHNLAEVIDAAIHLIKHPQASVKELMQFIQGPDFPTGGIIYNLKDIEQAYATGKGSIITRAKAEIVENKKSDFAIIVTEIPYQVNKAAILDKIAELVRNKKIEGIKDLRDESAKEGVRIVIELKKDSFPNKVLNQLYTHTPLQQAFHVNMLTLINGLEPRILSLKMMLEEFIKHRQTTVTKKTKYDLKKAKERAHILAGLMIALNKIDAVIKVIKASKDRETAKTNLIKKFKLTASQAIAILEMKLQQLASLERLKIETELKEKRKLIKELTAILKSPKKILAVITDELNELKDKYADKRRTKVVKSGVKEFTAEDLIPDEPTIVILTRDGYIKRLPPETFKTQARGGKGILGLTTREEDSVEHFFTTTTHKDILFFSTSGHVFRIKTYELPIASRTAKGHSIVNFLQLQPQEKISAVLPVNNLAQEQFLVMVTNKGTIKKVHLKQFENIRRSGLIAIKLKKNDSLENVRLSSGKDEVIILTVQGQAIRFKESNLRPMGRASAGVRGIKLKEQDEVIGLDIIPSSQRRKAKLLVITEKGYGKMTLLTHYRQQTRGGSGIKTVKVTSKTGQLASAFVIEPNTLPLAVKGDLVIISAKGQVIRLSLKSIPTLSRATQGVRLMKFKEASDKVASVVLV